MVVAAQQDADAGDASMISRFPPVPEKMREGRNTYMRHRQFEEWKTQLATAVTACMTAPVWSHKAALPITEPEKATVDLTVRYTDAPPERPAVRDYSCSRRIMAPQRSATAATKFRIPVTAADMVSFAGSPLRSLNLDEHVQRSAARGSDGGLSRSLPFDVSAMAEARTYVGVQMIKRLTDDLVRSANAAVGTTVPQLRYLNGTHVEALKAALAKVEANSPRSRSHERDAEGESETKGTVMPDADGDGDAGAEAAGEADAAAAGLGFDEETSEMLAEARRRLLELRERLVKQQVHDAGAIANAVPMLEHAANDVAFGDGSDDEEAQRLKFWLERSYGGRARLSFQFLVAGLLSSTAMQQLQTLNPFLSTDGCGGVLDTVVVVLLTTSRFGQANRCIASVDTLLHEVHHLVEARLMKSFYARQAAARKLRRRRVHRSPPTRQLVEHVLQETGYHALRAQRRLEEVIEMIARLVQTPPATVGVAAHTGGASVRSLVELAAHLNGFDEAKAVEAMADPSEIMSVLSMASRGCYRNGVKLPNVSASVLVARGATEESALAMVHVLQHTADSVAADLVTRRHFIDMLTGTGPPESAEYEYDPRFLVFEYLLGFVLRKRQVELVRQFAGAAQKSQSSVRQMIMGAGKTTVIAPLLALMLADGQSLVTNVVPSSLLEQTLGIMRGAFSSLIQKRCYTLQFDRMSESSSSLEALAALVRKMERARRSRSIVCSTPEAIKSVMLKYVPGRTIAVPVAVSGWRSPNLCTTFVSLPAGTWTCCKLWTRLPRLCARHCGRWRRPKRTRLLHSPGSSAPRHWPRTRCGTCFACGVRRGRGSCCLMRWTSCCTR